MMMPRTRSLRSNPSRRRRPLRLVEYTRIIVAALVWLALALPAAADVLKLKSGSVLMGKVESKGDESLKFRTEMGIVEVKNADIAGLEPGPAPWEEYEKIKSGYADTADGQYQLGLWCREHAMPAKARAHFRKAIDRDPDHEAARLALGHYRDGNTWKAPGAPPKSAATRPALPAPAASQPDIDRAARAKSASAKPSNKMTPEEKLLRDLITRWNVRITAIFNSKLKTREPGSKLFEEGRRQILAIQDPLAISVIGGILSKGGRAVRLVMVEALAGFKNEGRDESTMNLVVISLFDPDPVVRTVAARALVPRQDERIVTRFRKALSSNEDMVIRNAAVVLGMMRSREAVRDLAKCLYTVERRTVRYARQEIIGDVYRSFNGQSVIVPHDPNMPGSERLIYRPDGVAVLATGTLVGTRWVDEQMDVKFFRTDVQEALIAITGQNFGFEPEAWLKWADDHEKKP